MQALHLISLLLQYPSRELQAVAGEIRQRLVEDPALPQTEVAALAPLLTRLVCDVARYYLYDDLAPEHEVYLRYKAAERELGQIAEGKTVLSCPWGGAPGQLVAGDAPGDAEVHFSFSPRQITDDSMRGFA